MFLSLRLDGDLSRIAKVPNFAMRKKQLEQQNNDSLYDISRYLTGKNNTIDASKIISYLYPQKKCDIFISHSHKDEDDALDLKFKLELLGLTVFVDSVVWGNSVKMLESIDKIFCMQKNLRYNYDKRNRSTANIYLMLNSALQKMIDQCELFIFLGTENTLSMEDSINNEENLMSPWIFSELSFSQLVRRSLPDTRKTVALEESKTNIICDAITMNFIYHTPMLDKKMCLHKFLRWSSNMFHNNIRGSQTLDELYRDIMGDKSSSLEELYQKMISF